MSKIDDVDKWAKTEMENRHLDPKREVTTDEIERFMIASGYEEYVSEDAKEPNLANALDDIYAMNAYAIKMQRCWVAAMRAQGE